MAADSHRLLFQKEVGLSHQTKSSFVSDASLDIGKSCGAKDWRNAMENRDDIMDCHFGNDDFVNLFISCSNPSFAVGDTNECREK